ncbi:hypothetical protein J6590_065249 [Homalodisca vitripennis]|nr:hypothetical protein J6590_065249 [Homalodisca vitripennis]
MDAMVIHKEVKALLNWKVIDAVPVLTTEHSDVLLVVGCFLFPLGRPTAMQLNLKGFLRTLETHHEAHQSTTSAVPQTAENNLSSPPGKIHHPCPNYQRWHTALLLLQGNQRAGAQQSPPAHYTFHRADPPEGCRLCEDASSGDHAPEGPKPPWRKVTVIPFYSFSNPDATSTYSHAPHESIRDNPRGFTPWNTAERSFVPNNPLMIRNPTNGYIVDSGKGGNGLIAILNQFGFDLARVQRHQRCLTVRENINRLAPISQTKILTSTFHNSCDLRLKDCRIRTHRDHQLPTWSE